MKKWFKKVFSKKIGSIDDAVQAPQEGGDPETPYQRAADLEEEPEEPEELPPRHLCFGRLFDMRVGTVVACSVNVVLRIVFLLFDVSLGMGRTVATDYYALILSLVGVFGALNYEYLATGISALGLMWLLGAHLVAGHNIPGVIYDILIIYPTAVISYELFRGILTKENYEEVLELAVAEAEQEAVEEPVEEPVAAEADDEA
jgi:hypothetical protein